MMQNKISDKNDNGMNDNSMNYDGMKFNDIKGINEIDYIEKNQIESKSEYKSSNPIVGLFTNTYVIGRLDRNRATAKMVNIAKAAQKSGVVLFFFSVDDVNWYDKSISGIVYVQNIDKWERKKLPFPDILYDRGGGFTVGCRQKAKHIRAQLKKVPEIITVNSTHYFDKWQLYSRLSRHPEMKKYLPRTVLYRNDTKSLETMLNRYGVVYIKKCLGSNGCGVMRVIKQSDAQFDYSFVSSKVEKESAATLENIIIAAGKLRSRGRLIIQQGIDVIKYNGNMVDIRVLAQKGIDGKWQITCMPVRFASNESPITSTRSGSNVYTFDRAFEKILKFDKEHIENIKAGIKELVAVALNTVETEYGNYGELGIDVSLDTNGKLWFIEANAKPAKDTVLIAGNEDDIDKAYRTVFEYTKYLKEFGK